MENQLLANRIKTIRLSKGLSQEQFGNLFSPVAARSIVSRWENGKSIPNPERIKKIASLGHISVDDLVNGSVSERTKAISNYIFSVYRKNFNNEGFPTSHTVREILMMKNEHKEIPSSYDARLVSAVDIIFIINEDNYINETNKDNKNYILNMKKGLEYCSNQINKHFIGWPGSSLGEARLFFNFQIEAENHSRGYTPTNKGLLTAAFDGINESILNIQSIANIDSDPTMSSVPLINKDFYNELLNLLNSTSDKIVKIHHKYE